MRIIAGEFRGRRLAAPEGTATRPLLDRVREALFSTLGDLVDGARVLDLFAGSGALGLEALSRGNGHAEPAADPEADALRRVHMRDVRSAIARLPWRDREVILLAATENWDGAAAAEILGISHAAFKMRLHRARVRLSEILGERR